MLAHVPTQSTDSGSCNWCPHFVLVLAAVRQLEQQHQNPLTIILLKRPERAWVALGRPTSDSQGPLPYAHSNPSTAQHHRLPLSPETCQLASSACSSAKFGITCSQIPLSLPSPSHRRSVAFVMVWFGTDKSHDGDILRQKFPTMPHDGDTPRWEGPTTAIPHDGKAAVSPTTAISNVKKARRCPTTAIPYEQLILRCDTPRHWPPMGQNPRTRRTNKSHERRRRRTKMISFTVPALPKDET